MTLHSIAAVLLESLTEHGAATMLMRVGCVQASYILQVSAFQHGAITRPQQQRQQKRQCRQTCWFCRQDNKPGA